MKIELADRIRELPPYLFARIDALKKEAAQEGQGSHRSRASAIPTCRRRRTSSPRWPRRRATRRPTATRRTSGMEDFRRGRRAASCRRRFGVTLDPDKEVIVADRLEGGHRPLPVRASSTRATSCWCPTPATRSTRRHQVRRRRAVLRCRCARENGFLPDLDAIPADVARRAKILWINYPNNPTGGARRRRLLRGGGRASRSSTTSSSPATSPTARSYYDGAAAVASCETPGATDVGIEFHSLSKTYNMTGWRVGLACGNRDADRAASAR